jgi:hypothetical protein
MKLFFFIGLINLLVCNLLANKYDCIIASKKYEKEFDIPQNLLVSISLTESGKKINTGEFISWPWTINRKGKGKFFENKESAINFVEQYINGGRKNIDIGCMQVNYMYHPNAFKDFKDAFDPDKNVRWAAKMLKSLYLKFGSWKSAVGYYHSYRNSKRKKYSAKVFNTLISLENKNNFNFIKIAEAEKILNNETKQELKEKHKALSLVHNKIKTQNINKIEKNFAPTHSEYILARMEKVNFFRNYFYNANKN